MGAGASASAAEVPLDDLDPRNQPDAEDEVQRLAGKIVTNHEKVGRGHELQRLVRKINRSNRVFAERAAATRRARASRSSAEGRADAAEAPAEASDEAAAARGVDEADGEASPARAAVASPYPIYDRSGVEGDPAPLAAPESKDVFARARATDEPAESKDAFSATVVAADEPAESKDSFTPARATVAADEPPESKGAFAPARATVAADEPAESKSVATPSAKAAAATSRWRWRRTALAVIASNRFKQGAARGEAASSRVEEKRGGGGGGGDDDDDASDEYADDDFEEFEEGDDGGLLALLPSPGHERGPTTSFVSVSAAERKHEARRRWARVRQSLHALAKATRDDDGDDKRAPAAEGVVRRWSPPDDQFSAPPKRDAPAGGRPLAPAGTMRMESGDDDEFAYCFDKGRRRVMFHPEIRVVLIERYDRELLPDLFYTGQEIDGFHRDAYAEEAEANRPPAREEAPLPLLPHEKEEIAKKISAAAAEAEADGHEEDLYEF